MDIPSKVQIEEDMLHYPKEQSRNKDVESFDDSESEDTLTDENFEVLIKTNFLIQLALCIWISAWTVLIGRSGGQVILISPLVREVPLRRYFRLSLYVFPYHSTRI